jgi:hypothetical protein
VTKIAGSGSISQKHGSENPDPDPDPPQNVMDPEHWLQGWEGYWKTVNGVGRYRMIGGVLENFGRNERVRRMREVLEGMRRVLEGIEG